MKKRFRILMTAFALAALVLLGACGNAKKPTSAEDMAGIWKTRDVAYSKDAGVLEGDRKRPLSSEEMQFAEKLKTSVQESDGETEFVTLILNSDSTCTIRSGEEGGGDQVYTYEGTWRLEASGVTVTLDEEPVTLELKDGKLYCPIEREVEVYFVLEKQDTSAYRRDRYMAEIAKLQSEMDSESGAKSELAAQMASQPSRRPSYAIADVDHDGIEDLVIAYDDHSEKLTPLAVYTISKEQLAAPESEPDADLVKSMDWTPFDVRRYIGMDIYAIKENDFGSVQGKWFDKEGRSIEFDAKAGLTRINGFAVEKGSTVPDSSEARFLLPDAVEAFVMGEPSGGVITGSVQFINLSSLTTFEFVPRGIERADSDVKKDRILFNGLCLYREGEISVQESGADVPADKQRARLHAYYELLKSLREQENPYEGFTQYALADVNADGKQELFVYNPNGSMAQMVERMYTYDEEGDAVKPVGGFNPGTTYYSNGYCEEPFKHNQSGSEMWPVTVSAYDVQMGTTAFVATFHSERDQGGSLDKDGDGIVYIESKNDGTNYFTRSEYEEARNRYFQGLTGMKITEWKEIAAIETEFPKAEERDANSESHATYSGAGLSEVANYRELNICISNAGETGISRISGESSTDALFDFACRHILCNGQVFDRSAYFVHYEAKGSPGIDAVHKEDLARVIDRLMGVDLRSRADFYSLDSSGYMDTADLKQPLSEPEAYYHRPGQTGGDFSREFSIADKVTVNGDGTLDVYFTNYYKYTETGTPVENDYGRESSIYEKLPEEIQKYYSVSGTGHAKVMPKDDRYQLISFEMDGR